MTEAGTESIIEFFVTHQSFFILIIIAIVILGWVIIGALAKMFKKITKDLKLKKLNVAGIGLELERDEAASAVEAPLANSPTNSAVNVVTPITIPFENFNTMIKHCVKVAIAAADSKYEADENSLKLQNQNAQALLEEVMSKITHTYQDKKVKENISNGDADPYHDASIIFFSNDFNEDFKNVVFPRIDQFLETECLAFADEVDLANMCKTLEAQIISAIEDKLNKDRYSVNRELAKDSFNACKQALSEALSNSLHKAKKISITNCEDIKKMAVGKDDELNNFLQAYTTKEVKTDFIAKELLEKE